MDEDLKSFNVSRFQSPSQDPKDELFFDLEALYPVINSSIKSGKIPAIIKELNAFSSYLTSRIKGEKDSRTKADYELIAFTLKFSSDTLDMLDKVLS